MVRDYAVVGVKSGQGRTCPLWLTVCLAVAAVLLLVSSIVLLVLFFQKEDPKTTAQASKGQNICVTKDCVETASSIINSVSRDVKPCEDFYEFACGTYIKKNPVPDDLLQVSVHKTYEDLYYSQLRELIEGDFTHGTSRVLLRAQEAYHVCLNTSYQASKEFKSFKRFVKRELGGWPFVAGKDWEPRESLEEFLGNIQLLGIEVPFGVFEVQSDSYDPSKSILAFRAPNGDSDARRGRSSPFSSKAKISGREKDEKAQAQAYFDLLKNVAAAVSDTGSHGQIKDIMKMLLLQTTIEEVNDAANSEDPDGGGGDDEDEEAEYVESDDEEDQQDDGDEADERSETMTMKQMNEFANGTIDWLKVLNTQFKGIHVFTEDDWVMADETYVTALSAILHNTSRRTIADYVVWSILMEILEHGSPQTQKFYYDFYIATYPETYRQPFRWTVCIDWIQSVYPFAITRFFADEYVDPHSKASVDEMIQMVVKAYKKMIRTSEWLDKRTKRNALKKANHMKRFIGYPDFIFDDTKLETYYNYIPAVRSVHFDNFIEAKSNYTRSSLLEYTRPPEMHKWSFNPMEINAFYDPWSNSIWFPTGILQLPYFDDSRPAAVNFGMIGAVIGHEIGHGFDNTGKDFDEIGRWRDWWTEETYQKYTNLTECYIEQYNNYCPEELAGVDDEEKLCVNGKQTLDENIADTTGLAAAYEAYKIWVHKHGKELRLPGLQQYTPKQIFFISFAYSFCENIPIDNWQKVYEAESHAPAKYRVIGSLSNYPEFSEAFKCPRGLMNNGDERCTMW